MISSTYNTDSARQKPQDQIEAYNFPGAPPFISPSGPGEKGDSATILTCGHYAGACSCPEEEDCEMSSPRGWPLEVAKPLDNSHCRVRLLPGINPFQKIWSRLTSRTRLKIGGQPIKRELILPERITITDFIKPKAGPPLPVRAARRCGQRCGHTFTRDLDLRTKVA